MPLDPWLDLGSSEAGSDITESTHTLPLGNFHRDCTLSVEVTLFVCVWAVMLKRDICHLSNIRANCTTSPYSDPNLHLLIFQMPCTAVTAFCNRPNLLRKDDQSECHGEGSRRQSSRPTGHIHPQDRVFCMNFSAPDYSSH